MAGGWQVLELQSYNLMHKTRRLLVGAPSWDERIVVIAIDDASIEELGQFPWPRQTHAQLLDRLWSAQPAAVSFDLLFPDTTDDDALFADAIVNSANVVLAEVDDGNGGRPPISVSPTIAAPADGFFLSGDVGNQTDIDGISRRIWLYSGNAPSLSVAALQVYTETINSTTQAIALNPSKQPSALDLDIPARSHPNKTHKSGRTHFPSSNPGSQNNLDDIQSQLRANQPMSPPPFSRLSKQSFEFGTALVNRLSDRIPDDKTLWISWPGEVLSETDARQPGKKLEQKPGQLQVYSYADVLKGRVDNSHFQNKIVIVGATATGLDPLRTPFQSNPPTNGVYLHAATIDNLLNQSFLKRPPEWQRILLLVVLAIVSTYLLQRQSVYRRLAVLVGFPLAWSGFAYGSFLLGWWLPIAAPLGTVVLGGLAIPLREQQEKQQLMDIFSMNVSSGTAELIWQHKDAILHRGELAAQTLTATVLFMDIRGFTGIAEALPSHQLLPWLNQYFETMTDCIMSHGGMVDKYIGDAIMAVFGAPLPRTTQAEIQADAIAALQAALEMHDRLDILNHQLAAQNLPNIEFGIGIHTGSLIGGTVGSRHRLNYSVFGDTVNIAARLESMTKGLPAAAPLKLLVSADTYRYTQGTFPVELFQSGNLRGRRSSTDVYIVKPDTAPFPAVVPASAIAPLQPTIGPQQIAV